MLARPTDWLARLRCHCIPLPCFLRPLCAEIKYTTASAGMVSNIFECALDIESYMAERIGRTRKCDDRFMDYGKQMFETNAGEYVYSLLSRISRISRNLDRCTIFLNVPGRAVLLTVSLPFSYCRTRRIAWPTRL